MPLSKTKTAALALVSGVLAVATPADAGETPAPEGASVSFYSPAPGSEINTPYVHVIMNIEGMGIAPAGTEKPNTGHHHLLINVELEDENAPIPADEQHIHFGAGQTEAKINLTPGTYTLQLVLGDANHIPHTPVVQSEPITIKMMPPVSVSPAHTRYWPLHKVPAARD